MYKDSYPPETTPDRFEHLLTTFKDWSLANGLTVRPPPHFSENPHEALATHAPVSLYPSLYPRSSFESARAVQTAYNELYARVSEDSEFLDVVTEEFVPLPSSRVPLHMSFAS